MERAKPNNLPTQFVFDNDFGKCLTMRLSVQEVGEKAGRIIFHDENGELAVACFFDIFAARKVVGKLTQRPERLSLVSISTEEQLMDFAKTLAQDGISYFLVFGMPKDEQLPITVLRVQDFLKGKIMPIHFGQNKINPKGKK